MGLDLRAGILGFQHALIIKQPGVHHLAHHRPCHAAAGFAVFDHYRDDDLRVFGRGESDKQGVVAVALGCLQAVVALALLDRHHLCSTAFAGNPVLRTLGSCPGNAARVVHDQLHRMVDLLPVPGVAQHDIGDRVVVSRRRAVDGFGQVRTVPHALVGNQCSGLRQLQRRDLHVALANPQNHRFAGEPCLATGAALPFAGGHQARGLFKHVQRDLLSQPEHRHVVVHAVDAQLGCQVIKIGVVGAHDCRVQVHPAITAVVPVAVLVVDVGQLEIAGVEHPGRGRDDAAVEPGNRHFRLDGRARRIQATQGPVEQRLVDGIAQGRVVSGADTGHEQVRIEAGFADHRQHFAGFRVQGND